MNTNNQTDRNKQALTLRQKQEMKKYAVFALLFIIFGACLWWIYAPPSDDKAKSKATQGFNTDIPLPKEEGLIGDKQDAYEQEQIKQKQSERMRSLQDFSTLLDGESHKTDEPNLTTEAHDSQTNSDYVPPSRKQSSMQTSAQAYHDMNRTLGTFYEQPKVDPEKEALKKELEELKARIDESENRKDAADNQLALMEKSFQMAAKYMPGTTGTPATSSAEPVVNIDRSASGKTTVIPVGRVREQTVSSLQPEMSGAEIIETCSQPRNMGFFTVTNETNSGIKNTISACVLENQTVMDGENVRLRLLEPMQAGKLLIPENTILSCFSKIQGERLQITINSLEFGSNIIPVEMAVYDTDGQRGIFIPDTREINAVKEIVAGMGTNAGTSINLSNDAGKQFAADMGRNVIQGVSGFFSKKMREVKVSLKAGYRVFLLSEGNINNQQLASN